MALFLSARFGESALVVDSNDRQKFLDTNGHKGADFAGGKRASRGPAPHIEFGWWPHPPAAEREACDGNASKVRNLPWRAFDAVVVQAAIPHLVDYGPLTIDRVDQLGAPPLVRALECLCPRLDSNALLILKTEPPMYLAAYVPA